MKKPHKLAAEIKQGSGKNRGKCLSFPQDFPQVCGKALKTLHNTSTVLFFNELRETLLSGNEPEINKKIQKVQAKSTGNTSKKTREKDKRLFHKGLAVEKKFKKKLRPLFSVTAKKNYCLNRCGAFL